MHDAQAMAAPYSRVLVQVDASMRSTERVNAAVALAGAHGAALTALYTCTLPYASGPATIAGGATAAAMLGELYDAQRARTRERVEAQLSGRSLRWGWAEADVAALARSFTRQALYADLLVLGQHEPGTLDPVEIPPDFAASVAIDSGKPALVIPFAGSAAMPPRRIAIAWKETRESARAVAAALPLLRGADEVHLLTWDDGQDAPGVSGDGLDVQGWLRGHGVTARVSQGGRAAEQLGELLLSRCFDLGADLLVMGCYGHGRAREWVMGGVTRTVLRSMTLPVLMMH